MKYIKEYNKYENNYENDIYNDIVDIFSYLLDYNLYVSDVFRGNALSIGDNEIIIDHNDFSSNDIFKSISVRLKLRNKGDFLLFGEDAFIELRDAVGHVESYFGLELMHIYLRNLNGIWFNNVDSMEKYIENLNFMSKKSLKMTIYIDITFKNISQL